MMTLHKIYRRLRDGGRGQYLLLSFCLFLSVLLISAFSLMYCGPTVQEFLPEGGDTRKMAALLMAVTALGCGLFTIYASKLFFRYKSREYGILLALGLSRKQLSRLLIRELSAVSALSALAGLVCAVPLSFLIWKLFELFIISTDQMRYRFGLSGFLPGIAFAAVLILLLSLVGKRFVKKADIMDTLRTQHKTEMVREIKPWILPAGLILIAAGILLGAGLPKFAASVLRISLPAVFNAVYLLSALGIYLVLLSAVSQSRVKKHKEKYYRNLVSISLMRFSAKAATRSMCVIVLILFTCCFSAFYGTQYTLTPVSMEDTGSKGFTLHYPAEEEQISKADIYHTARQYQMEITDYAEGEAANLVISYRGRDFNEAGDQYVDVYSQRQSSALFLSVSEFTALTGQKASVRPGRYLTVVQENAAEGFFDFWDGLTEIENPDTGKSLPVTFDQTVVSGSVAAMSNPFAYVISDQDYETLTKGLSPAYKECLPLFDVADEKSSYAFAKDLLRQYASRATAVSSHLSGWDPWAEKLAEEAGKTYGYADPADTDPDNPMLLSDWRYAPQFSIVTSQDILQLLSVYVMLCLYICIISLAAVSVMTYVRSISVASDNRDVFACLDKLGAGRQYKLRILKKQLQKIFQYPAAIGCGLGLLFSLSMDWFNDGRLTGAECKALLVLCVMIAVISLVLFAVYQLAKKTAVKAAGIE